MRLKLGFATDVGQMALLKQNWTKLKYQTRPE